MSKSEKYDIGLSPFYKLSNQRTLEELLYLPKYFLRHFHSDDKYNVFEIPKSDGSARTIHNPCVELKKVQKRLLSLLRRIKTPKWLMSGKKGVSYIDNAYVHKDNDFVITCDISSFYDNTKRKDVYNMFCKKFLMSPDVAGKMTDLVAYFTQLPTGAPTSQLIAYLTYSDTFFVINKLAELYNSKFTLYVDDMTFSSDTKISGKLLYEVKLQLKLVGLKIKDSKTCKYGKNDFKKITGVTIKNSKMFVPNKQRAKIINKGKDVLNSIIDDEQLIRSCKGVLTSAKQIEPDLLPYLGRMIDEKYKTMLNQKKI